MAGIFDSHHICLYRETIQWQGLPPMRYVSVRYIRWRPLLIIAYGHMDAYVEAWYRVCFLLSWKLLQSFDVITWKFRPNRDYCVGQVFLSVV